MLYLIGAGLDIGDISVGAILTCKHCDLYVDRYTSYMNEERMKYLSNLFGKDIHPLERADLEENLPPLLKRALTKDIAIIAGGDPLVATTHKIIFLEARKIGLQVKVIHSSSVISALIGESGLDFYRFGQICTISRWSKHYTPVSFYETIQKNLKGNLHSLVLLDYEPSKNASLELKEAVRILEEAEKKYKGKIIKPMTMVFVMHKVALPDNQRMITTLKRAKLLTFGNGPTAIIIPAKLTEIEREVMGSMF